MDGTMHGSHWHLTSKSDGRLHGWIGLTHNEFDGCHCTGGSRWHMTSSECDGWHHGRSRWLQTPQQKLLIIIIGHKNQIATKISTTISFTIDTIYGTRWQSTGVLRSWLSTSSWHVQRMCPVQVLRRNTCQDAQGFLHVSLCPVAIMVLFCL